MKVRGEESYKTLDSNATAPGGAYAGVTELMTY